MTLIILLIALALQYFTNTISVLPRFKWFDQYVNIVGNFLAKTSVWGTLWGLLALIVPILIGVGIIDIIVHGRLFGLIEFLFSLLVLLYCLRAENLKSQLNDYFAALETEDLTKAGNAAKEFLGKKAPEDAAGLARAVTQGIFQKAIVQCFSYIFWFILFGPYGVMLYFVVRELHLLATKEGSELKLFLEVSKKTQAVLDWLPIRLVALSYALVGHFTPGFAHWIRTFLKGLDVENQLAWTSGLAAMDAKINSDSKASISENVMAINLVNNAVIVWVVVVAIFILGYWFA